MMMYHSIYFSICLKNRVHLGVIAYAIGRKQSLIIDELFIIVSQTKVCPYMSPARHNPHCQSHKSNHNWSISKLNLFVLEEHVRNISSHLQLHIR